MEGIVQKNVGKRTHKALLSLGVHTLGSSLPLQGTSDNQWLRIRMSEWDLVHPTLSPRVFGAGFVCVGLFSLCLCLLGQGRGKALFVFD